MPVPVTAVLLMSECSNATSWFRRSGLSDMLQYRLPSGSTFGKQWPPTDLAEERSVPEREDGYWRHDAEPVNLKATLVVFGHDDPETVDLPHQQHETGQPEHPQPILFGRPG